MLIHWIGWWNSSANVNCYVRSSDPNVRRPDGMDKFTLVEIGEMTKEKQDEYHRVTTKTAVHGLQPLSRVEAPWWRYCWPVKPLSVSLDNGFWAIVTQLLLFRVVMTNREMITVLNSASQRHVIKYTHLHEMKWGKEVSREYFNTSAMWTWPQMGGKVW